MRHSASTPCSGTCRLWLNGPFGRGSSPPMSSTRCTPYSAAAFLRNSLNSSRSLMRRADTCGTGSSPAPRIAAMASSVRDSGSPGSDGMYIQLSAGRIADTSAARCSSRGEISSEPPISSSESRACSSVSVALAGYDIGLVQEPQGTVLLQHFARGVEILRAAEHLGEPLVLDLRDVDRGVPGGEQGRGADARRDLGRQRVHVVAEDRPRVGVGVEVVAPSLAAAIGPGGAHDAVPR